MALNIGNKVYRNLQEQVGYNSVRIDNIEKLLDGINIQENLINVPDLSYVLTEEDLEVASKEVAFIFYNDNVYIKRNQENGIAYFDIIFKINSSTVISFESSEIEVTMSSGTLSLSELEVSTYSASVIDNKIEQVASGSPKGAYATLADLQTAYPTGAEGIYLVADDGNWYYWDGAQWASGGVYLSNTPLYIETLELPRKTFTSIYARNASDYSYTDYVLEGTLNGADSSLGFFNTMSANHKYMFCIKVDNVDNLNTKLFFSVMNASTYSWIDSVYHNIGWMANVPSRYFVFTAEFTADWLWMLRSATSGGTLKARVYCFDVTDLSDEELAIVKNWATEGMTSDINISIIDVSRQAQWSAESELADNAKEAHGRWYGKKIWFCGDSITEYGYYPPVVASLLGANSYYQDGHPGNSIAGCCAGIVADPSLISNYDLITIFAGTNDFGGNKELGQLGDTTDTTTYGSIYVAISTLVTAYPEKKFAFITPVPRGKFESQPDYDAPNARGKYLTDYVNAIRQTCEKYHIPCIDIYDKIGWNEFNITTVTIDGLHPTESATAKSLSPLIAEELKNI